jgi:uncharacterized membrane protein YdjX (TVP38/TMEM64 family)
MSNRASSWKVVLLLAAGLATAVASFWWFKIHDYSVRLSIDAGLAALRSAGPLPFFVAMAVLPALGFPMSIFYLAVGSAFAETMGLPGVLAASGAAVFVNVALTYWLAAYGLRPWLVEMIGRTKYKIPELAATDHAQLTLIIRITPGPPFFMQGYLLGLAGVRFFTYQWISWTVAMALGSGVIVFGDAILHGKGRAAFLGLSAMVGVTLIIHFLRRHYGKKAA